MKIIIALFLSVNLYLFTQQPIINNPPTHTENKKAMRRSPFNPDVTVYSHSKTWLTELLANRLPKGYSICETCRWEDDSLFMGTSKQIVFMITPGSFQINRLNDMVDSMNMYAEKSCVLISEEPERGKRFDYTTLTQIKKAVNTTKLPVFTSLNECATYLKEKK